MLNESNVQTVDVWMSLSTAVSEDDGEWIDRYGVKYSADRKKLISANKFTLGKYKIKDGTIVICDNAFSGCESLVSVIIPDSVEIIGKHAFAECLSMTSAHIPKKVANIKYSTFSGCKKLRSVEMSDGVRLIEDRAFYGCKSLKHIRIPDNVAEIGSWAFGNCSNLRQIKLPERLTEIGNDAFRGCKRIGELDLPDNLESIGSGGFFGCSSLSHIHLPKSLVCISVYEDTGEINNPFCYSGIQTITSDSPNVKVEGHLLIQDTTVIAVLGRPSQITFPDFITEIANGAISNQRNLTAVNILCSGFTDKEEVKDRFTQMLSDVSPDKIKLIDFPELRKGEGMILDRE